MLRSTDTPSFISATEAALRLGVSAETVRKHCRTGTYPAERRNTPYGMAWFVDASALPAQPVPDTRRDTDGPAPEASAPNPLIAALTAHIEELRGQLTAQASAHGAEIARMVQAHSRELETLRDINRDQYAILERLSIPRLTDSQPAVPRPWWKMW